MRMTVPREPMVAIDLSTVDLTDPALYGEGEPHAIFAALREHDPVHWQPVGSTGFWSVTRYHDAKFVLANARAFTSERGTGLSMLGHDDPAGGSQMATTDPPRHGCLRTSLNRPLRAEAVSGNNNWLRQRIRELIHPATLGEAVDFAAAMMELSTAIAELLMDLPPADRPRLTRLVTAAVAPDDPDYADDGAGMPRSPPPTANC